MFKKSYLLAGRIALVALALAVLAFLVYQIPAVNSRLGWRLDFAMAYVRGVINPVQALPTPRVVQAAVEATQTPTSEITATPALITPTPAPPTLTPTITLTPTAIPGNVQLPAPAWEKQDINNCGPATLSMYLRFYGWEGDQKAIAGLVKPVNEDRNVNVEELLYYTRTKVGWLNFEYRVGGNTDLLRKFIAAGIPVMIEETFMMAESYWPNDDRWAGHYLLVTGYDDSRELFTTQDSFVSADLRVSYRDLDTNWRSFNRVYILVYRPDQEETVKAILGEDWDKDVNRQNALEAAQAETEKDPSNGFAWFNLGSNLVYFDRYDEASKAYDQARKVGLPQRMLRYQFGPFLAYFHSLRTDELLALTEYALKITPNSEEALLWRGWGLFRSGDREGAVALFQKALAENPTYQDAVYALDYVNSN
ncbi:MAG: tetratricopeptide repeat protein [Anaerolineae bacterium]|nr:tetratricopeptide repeat protein [Anaerolineae bacterium]